MGSNVTIVIEIVGQVLKNSGLAVPVLNGSTRILQETPMDSLGLAEVVVKLEQRFKKDPFKNGFIHFSTIDELARLYE